MAYEDEKKGELETLLNDILEDKNTNLTPENLKKGVTVLGIDGNYIGTDTSDATATNEDVLEGKTAYAQGQKLTGTLRVEDVDSVLDMFPSIETEISEEIDIKDAVENSFNDLSIYGNSRQESTTGKNLLYEIRSGYLTTVENQEATTTEGSQFGNWQINFKNKDGSTSISLEAGEYYVSLDLKINSGSVSNPLNLIALSNKDGQETINNPVPTTKYQRYCFKSIFNSAKNVNNIIIQKHYDEEICSFKIKNVMISKMSDYIYEPYTGGNPSPNPDYPQEIESIKDSITFKRIGKNYFNSEIEMGGYSSKGEKYSSDSRVRSINSFILKPDTYTISCKNATVISINSSSGGKEKTIESDKLTITLEEEQNCVLTVETTDLLNAKIQIEKGTEATEYEPYHEDVYTLPVQEEMLDGDTFEKVDGNWYEVHNRTFYECTGEENWLREKIKSSGKYRYGFYNYQFGTAKNRYSESICTHFKNFNQYGVIDNTFGIEQESIRFNFNPLKTFNSVEEFKNWLVEQKNGGTPVRIYYYLETPTKLQCTEEQTAVLNQLWQFSLDKGINHIFSDDELSPKFKLKYYQDMNILLDKINKNIADVSAEII